jgi:hypothetical protein
MHIKAKVVRVTATEFELEDGRVFPHVIELDPVPTPKEFQAFYDQWSERLKGGDVKNERSGQHPNSR